MVSELERIVTLESRPGDKSYMFLGPPGVGKTTLALMMAVAKPGKALLLDVDDKAHEMDSLLADPKFKQVQLWQPQEPLIGDELIIARAPDASNVKIGEKITKEPQGIRRVANVINELGAMKRAGTFPYNWTILDSWSRICDHVVRKCLFDHGVAFMSDRLWGIVTTNLNNVLNSFLQLPGNRVVIVHERHEVVRDRATDTIKRESIKPSSIGQTRDTMGREFSELWYFKGLNRATGKYQIQTVSDSLVNARTSKGLAADCDINDDGTLTSAKR